MIMKAYFGMHKEMQLNIVLQVTFLEAVLEC